MSSVSLYIARRYLRAKSTNNAINIMSTIASFGVIISAAALLIVLSVFSGLKAFSLEFSSYTDPDLKLLPKTGKSFDWQNSDMNQLLQMEGINAATKVIEERVVIKSGNKHQLVQLKGVDEHYLNVTQIDTMISRGNWLQPNSNQIVSGWVVSAKLAYDVINFSKAIVLYVPKPGKGQPSTLKSAYSAFHVNNVGVFNINEQLNSTYVFSDISLAKSLLNYNANQISAIEIKLNTKTNFNTVKQTIESKFPNRFIIKNRAQLNDALYKMLNTEQLAIYLIFTLVIIIALFNVIGALIMMILDRKKSLNTLYSLGMTPKNIRTIFFIQGSLLSLISGVIGVGIGLIIVGLQQQFGWFMMSAYLPFPVKLSVTNIILVLFTIITLGVVASKLASQRISKGLIGRLY